MKEFIINSYLSLRLDYNQTNIYVNGERFEQCKFILLNIPMDETERFDDIESIDEAADILGWTEERQLGVVYKIDPDTEFWGHCSNLQAWYEHNYDTRLLHSNLSFPLLKKLAEVGDPIANRVFKEEIVKRLESGYPTVIKYIIKEKLLEYLNREELRLVIDQGFLEPDNNRYQSYLNIIREFKRLFKDTKLKIPEKAKIIDLILNLPDKTKSIQILDKYTKSNEMKEKYDVYLTLSKVYPENMLIRQRLRKLVFLQESSLDLNYIPDKLLCRDDAITNLIFNFRRILEESEQPSINCLILGKSGLGKTAIARFFSRNFRKIADEKGKEIIVEYFNCFYFRSMSKIIRELIAKYTHVSGKGFGDPEALKLIFKILIREKRYMLLIIDEVHLLSPDDILSFLAINESFGHQNAKISIILITLKKEWISVETTGILSKLNSTFTLEPYNFDDIKSILKYRIELAFKKNVINEETLTFISKIVHNNGSLSNGIRLLRQCGLKAVKEGLEHINMDIIDTMSHEMYPTFRIQTIEQLKDQELLTLFGIVHSLINLGESYTLVDNAFEEYNIICETYSVEPHTKKTFRKYIQTLSKMRIISPRIVRIEEAERGRHLEISLIDITPERFENLLINIFDKKFS